MRSSLRSLTPRSWGGWRGAFPVSSTRFSPKKQLSFVVVHSPCGAPIPRGKRPCNPSSTLAAPSKGFKDVGNSNSSEAVGCREEAEGRLWFHRRERWHRLLPPLD